MAGTQWRTCVRCAIFGHDRCRAHPPGQRKVLACLLAACRVRSQGEDTVDVSRCPAVEGGLAAATGPAGLRGYYAPQAWAPLDPGACASGRWNTTVARTERPGAGPATTSCPAIPTQERIGAHRLPALRCVALYRAALVTSLALRPQLPCAALSSSIPIPHRAPYLWCQLRCTQPHSRPHGQADGGQTTKD